MQHCFDKKNLNDLLEIHGDMTLKQLIIFMFIVDNPDCTVNQIVEGTKIPYSVVSKVIRVLSHQGYGGRQGIFIISILSDPMDSRLRILRVNDKGRQLIRVLRDA